MTDPDMGTWQYRYNCFGELIWQKDAKGQITTLAYDALGRLVSRSEPEGATTWTYDTSPTKGLGKLHTVSGPGGCAETHLYDSLGRPSESTRTPDAGSGAFTVGTEYDSSGRPHKLTYPTGVVAGQRLAVRQVYNAFGYLKEIRHWLDADTGRPNAELEGRLYWQADQFGPAGRIEGETYGNGLANDRVHSAATGRLVSARIDRGANLAGPFLVQHLDYTYDAVGNVVRRNDQTSGFERDEFFYAATPGDGYDGLDRLKVHRIGGGATVTVAYDQRGNITAKSDVGSYAYGHTPAGRSNVLPHAVSGAGVHSYTYDANGNMLTGAGRTQEWSSFNQLRKVTSGGLSSEFSFGAGRERVKQVRRSGATVTDVTYYVGALYEKVVASATGRVEHKHYILAPTGRVAVLTQSTLHGVLQANTTRYLHTDGLGSITVVSDEQGAVLKRYAYDAWGKQATTYTRTAPGITNQAPTTRGYTDHEMLAEHGLIHMNGRVYDPVLGRFLSADPFVGDVGDSQEYNRYSYVGNNPLNATDPSGFFSLKDGLKIVALVVLSVVTYGAASAAWGAAFASTFGVSAAVGGGIAGGLAAGFASGFAGSLLNGGSIGDAFRAGVIGGAIGAVTGGIAGKLGIGGIPKDSGEYFSQLATTSVMGGVGGGVNAELNGGKFGDGFGQGAAYGAAGYVAFTGLNTYLNEQGETLTPAGGSKNPADYDRVTTNGIMGDRSAMQAKVDAASAVSGAKPTLGYYNPSQGIINDVMQSIWQKIAFGVGDSLAAGFGKLTSQMAPGPLTITAHSQGTLTVSNAILRGGVPKGSTLNMRSPAITYPRAWLAGRINGGTMHYIQPWGDGANLWSPSLNPLKFASGAIDIFARAKIHTGNYP